MRLSHTPVEHRVLNGAFSRLEPCAVKVACTVLRGRGDGNITPLPDPAMGVSRNGMWSLLFETIQIFMMPQGQV
jgi:hypothetical protein